MDFVNAWSARSHRVDFFVVVRARVCVRACVRARVRAYVRASENVGEQAVWAVEGALVITRRVPVEGEIINVYDMLEI